MFPVLAVILFAVSWVLHGSRAVVPVWFDWQALVILGLLCLALSVVPWQDWRRRP